MGDDPEGLVLLARASDEVVAAGATVERDEYRSFPMEHPDAGTFWAAMVSGGPLRRLANARGAAFMRGLRREFLELAPTGPWRHRPRARWILARRVGSDDDRRKD